MKIRIGIGLGTDTLANDQSSFAEVVETLEELGCDSLWLSDRLSGDCPDPHLALAFAAARTSKLKLGTSVTVIPGRNPVVLAKEMATLDRLSGGRFLPAVGLGAKEPVEHQAFGVQRLERAAWFDEALALMRRLWTEDDVSHHGERFQVEGLTLRPRPVQDPLEVWLGGRSDVELRRVGRLGDGWLPSFCTSVEVERGWDLVNSAAAAENRRVDPEHLGVLVAWSEVPLPEVVLAALSKRLRGVDPTKVIPVGPDDLRARIESFIEVGASKFVVVPIGGPASADSRGWSGLLQRTAAATFDLAN